MQKVRVTFDHPLIKGTLEIAHENTTPAAFKEQLSLGELRAHDGVNNYFYFELGDMVVKSTTLEPVHELPTEEGVYMDCDGGIWRINDAGKWLHLHAFDPPRTEPEQYMPFTQLKLGRTF